MGLPLFHSLDEDQIGGFSWIGIHSPQPFDFQAVFPQNGGDIGHAVGPMDHEQLAPVLEHDLAESGDVCQGTGDLVPGDGQGIPGVDAAVSGGHIGGLEATTS